MDLTEREQKARTLIVEAMEAVFDMDERGPLNYNRDEVIQSVHTLQSFVKQHVLHRLDPEGWSDWWEQDEWDYSKLPERFRDAAPYQVCSGCGRKSWDRDNWGRLCKMPQPGGTICTGIFRPSPQEPSDPPADLDSGPAAA